MEMEQWWQQNKCLMDGDDDNVRGDYTKDEVEDFTGCIPLLLNSCLVDGKINLQVAEMQAIWNQIGSFLNGIRKSSVTQDWDEYITLPKF